MSAIKNKYVVGFLFSADMRRVVLIRKERPEWQKGKYNGVGGHIEKKESPEQAMRREFLEECGVDIADWKRYLTITGKNFILHFLWATMDPLGPIKQMTDEQPFYFGVEEINEHLDVIPNLKWIIPMVTDPYLREYISIKTW